MLSRSCLLTLSWLAALWCDDLTFRCLISFSVWPMEHWSVPGPSMAMLCRCSPVKRVSGSELPILRKITAPGYHSWLLNLIKQTSLLETVIWSSLKASLKASFCNSSFSSFPLVSQGVFGGPAPKGCGSLSQGRGPVADGGQVQVAGWGCACSQKHPRSGLPGDDEII